jgi:hypothetical protein
LISTSGALRTNKKNVIKSGNAKTVKRRKKRRDIEDRLARSPEMAMILTTNRGLLVMIVNGPGTSLVLRSQMRTKLNADVRLENVNGSIAVATALSIDLTGVQDQRVGPAMTGLRVCMTAREGSARRRGNGNIGPVVMTRFRSATVTSTVLGVEGV